MPTFDLSASFLFASLFWGSIGTGMCIFGWKQKSGIALGGGAALVAFSYFVASWFWMSIASAAVLGFIFWLKKQGY